MSAIRKLIRVVGRGSVALSRLTGRTGGSSERFVDVGAGETSTAGAHDAVDILLVGFVVGTGGISILMMELGASLVSRGFRVKIVVPERETTIAYAEQCRGRGIEVERTSLLLERDSRLFRFINALRFVRRYRAPVVHYHANGDIFDHVFLYAMDLLDAAPAYFTPQGTFDEILPDESVREWAATVPRRFRKVICPSQRGVRKQREYGVSANRLRLVYNGVDVDRFASGDAQAARNELGLSEKVPLIVFTSRLEPQKRPLDAIRAFRLIADEFPDVRFVIVGDGSLASETRTEAERSGFGPRVHFMGRRDDVANWLGAATVWLLPTETEGFSLAVIEAMAAGCAIVSTPCPGNDEVLVHGENALLASVGDVNEMGQLLRRLISDADMRTRLGKSARLTARRYSLDQMSEEHIACYTDQHKCDPELRAG